MPAPVARADARCSRGHAAFQGIHTSSRLVVQIEGKAASSTPWFPCDRRFYSLYVVAMYPRDCHSDSADQRVDARPSVHEPPARPATTRGRKSRYRYCSAMVAEAHPLGGFCPRRAHTIAHPSRCGAVLRYCLIIEL